MTTLLKTTRRTERNRIEVNRLQKRERASTTTTTTTVQQHVYVHRNKTNNQKKGE